MPDSVVRMRSHTCNAVGSQLLIIGGYPPSAQVEKNATCDPELIKVLDMNTMTVSIFLIRLGINIVMSSSVGFTLHPWNGIQNAGTRAQECRIPP